MFLLEFFFIFDVIYTYQQCQDQYVSCKIQVTQVISTTNHYGHGTMMECVHIIGLVKSK
jgi:hypothetical protein